MTSASHMLDGGRRCPTKCLPAGTLQRRKKDGPGHWLVAYRKAEEQNYRSLHKRIKKTCKKCEDRVADPLHGVTLDGPFLLQLHCVDKPSELCSVNASEQKLNSVKAEDLKAFYNVAYIDASINSLSLASFSSFDSLKELNLSLNGICNLTFDAADFPHLEVLDLSYNSLSAEAIVSLGRLPRLKVLHLTGNQLYCLPPNLGSSSHDPTQLPAEEEDTQFKALEVLMLDDNKLSSGVFSCLTNLKRLKHLNLQGNHISEIPYMQLMGVSKPVQICTEERAEEEGGAPSESNANTDDHLKRFSQAIDFTIFHKDNWEEFCEGSSVPLPRLQFLDLANNKIVKEEALLAAALFPTLCEIDIHSNSLTTQRRGDPPVLTYYLQERLGITIKKKKKPQEGVKLPLKVSTGPKWKVEEKIPKVAKQPLLIKTICPARPLGDKSEETRTGSEDQKSTDCTFHENTEHFFFTQAADECDPPSVEKDSTQNEERNSPEQITSYRTLMDVKPNPDALKPIGIQAAVRMLEHTLKNLNVYRDSKPKLDSIQTPYKEREKRIKKLPPLKPVKQPTERVDEMIKEIKESATVKVVALDKAIHNKEEYKEAQSLLRDLKTKYKMVHKKTMERAASNQTRAEPPPAQTL